MATTYKPLTVHYSFELTMPVRMSVNGAWAAEWLADRGECIRHFIVYEAIGTKNIKLLHELANNATNGIYYYDFADCWKAQVQVECISERTYHKRKASKTKFCGYSWMVDSLLMFREIRSLRATPELQAKHYVFR